VSRCIVFTGATSGLGRAAVLELATKGDHLIIIARNTEKAERLKVEIEKRGGRATSVIADFSRLSDVSRAAQEIIEMDLSIDILVNNAGLFLSSREITEDGFEKTIAVNHLAPFLLTYKLLSILDRPNVRIVNVASRAHNYGSIDFDNMNGEKFYVGGRAYGSSKLANILFTRQLSKQLQQATTNCLHPGVVATNIAQGQGGIFGWFFNVAQRFMLTPLQGAQTLLFLCNSDKVHHLSGLYFDKCQKKKPAKKACSNEMAQKLWDWSLQQCQLYL
jgi:NAD(P)-dependent dehydrogenase (short-subunit alcohol dehydrogenase family)